MPAHTIESDDELLQLHERDCGFIYNDYSGPVPSGATGNLLHAAGCRYILRSKTNYRKYFFEELGHAIDWVTEQRGSQNSRWRKCKVCLGRR